MFSREDQPKLGNVINVEIDTIENVTNINLDKVNRAMLRVRKKNFLKDAIKSRPNYMASLAAKGKVSLLTPHHE